MSALPVTALYAGLLGLWLLALAYEVVRRRWRYDVSLGSGGEPELERAIRAHGNAAETIPIGLILLGLAEGMGTPGWILHVAGLSLLTGRVLHGVHFVTYPKPMRLRFWGMVLTVGTIAALSVGLVGHSALRLMVGA
ncbi:MAPEG family protein [Limibaculum sp. M0105]|uniref:MAPEG family protein n=1 Tax=Thermohalobaculum xanthum TaxID=2753746 RepID=A0A8J7M3V4_9RHOB|nr:MAPEG family protein [Thermohalobaculum xanthum]MBK0397881.1 MAPEG family protein [Thermohalobaculum xanthum]